MKTLGRFSSMAIYAFLLVIIALLWRANIKLNQELADFTVVTARSRLVTLDLLKAGQAQRAVAHNEESLLINLRTIAKEYGSQPSATHVLWKICDYFKKKNPQLPVEVRELLERLPKDEPRPERWLYSDK
jgi:hypothetical protein